jgi:hypothetical protein
MIAINSARVPAWLMTFCVGLCLSLSAYPQVPAPDPCLSPGNTVIQASGSPYIYLLHNGRKYYIQNFRWISKNGYGAVHILKPAEVAAIPSGYDLTEQSKVPGTPEALEGKLAVGLDQKVYVIQQGQRHWVLDGRWFAEHGYAGQQPMPVSQADLQELPLGEDFPYIPAVSRIWVLTLTLCLFTFFFLSARGYYRSLLNPSAERFAKNKLFQKWTTWHTRGVLLALFIAAIIAREPELLSHPRFWAEEGTAWFQYGSSHSVIQTLFFVYPASSYFALIANIGGVLSSMTAAGFGLEYAPAATTFLALLIQVLAIALILFGKSRLFNSLWKAVAGCLIVLFASTATDEIWLNSINSMSFLGLISLLLLFEETWNWPGWTRWGSRGLLILSGLSSPYTSALLPLFVVSAWREKQREQKIQCLILILCAFVQAGIVVRTRMETARNPNKIEQTPRDLGEAERGKHVRLDAAMVDIFWGHIAYPAAGYSMRERLLGNTGMKDAWITASSAPPRPKSTSLKAVGWFCFVLIAILLWRLKGAPLYCTTNLVIGAFLILSLFTSVASLNGVPLGRYAFLPGFTFLLLLLINVESSKSRIVPYVSMFVLSYGLACGMANYRLRQVQDGPSWSKEVQVWHTDHTHPLHVWPPGWEFVYSGPVNR